MTFGWDNLYVLGLAVATIVLLATERAHLSVLGVGLMVALATAGVLPAEAAVGGLATPALVTIASLFVVGDGFMRTGAASILADNVLRRTGSSEASVVFLVLAMAAGLSAFVNNTLVVVTFLPVITSICRATGIVPSRLLIPLSYASIVGGLCTLVGTSTNLLVSGELQIHGHPPLEMFTITPLGVLIAGVALLYLGLIGHRLLPRVPSLSTQMSGPLKEYVMEVTVGTGSPLLERKVAEVGSPHNDGGAKVMMLVRNETLRWPPFRDLQVQAGDILMLGGSISELAQMQKTESRAAENGDSYDPRTMSFFELALAPSSTYAGRRLGELALKKDFGAAVVAVQRAGRHLRDRLSSMTLQGGDVLLVFGDDRAKAYLRQSSDFHVLEGVQEAIHHTERAPWAFAIIVAVVVLFVTGWVHYSTAAMIGALAMTLTGCLTVQQTHRAIKWPIILFIGGMIALSKGLETTGTTGMIASWIRAAVPGSGGADHPQLLLAALFTATVFLTEFLTNNAVAVLMTPLGLGIASQAGLESAPFVMAVALGSSCSFANPMGYQTNLMVYGPGGYRFRDFVKVGLPLDLLCITVGVLVIPWFWPLREARPDVVWTLEDGRRVGTVAAQVTAGTRLQLDVDLPRPSLVYALAWNGHDMQALWPAPQQTLPPGRHRVPPGEGASWVVRPEHDGTSLVVVVSEQPLPSVQHLLAIQGDGGKVPVPRPPPPIAAALALESLPWSESTTTVDGNDRVHVAVLHLAVE